MRKTTNSILEGIWTDMRRLPRFLLIRLNNMPIGVKITVMYGGLFAIILFAVSLFLLGNVTYIYRRASLAELDQTAEKVADYIETGGLLTDQAVNELNPNKYVEIVISDGDMNGREEGPPVHTFPYSREDFKGDRVKPGQTVQIRTISYMFSEKTASYRGRNYLIRVFRNYQREQDILHIFTLVFMVLDIFGVAGAFFLGRTISHMTLRPVRRIIETAERISIEDLSRRIEVAGPEDEIRRLSVTFNDMIDRLEISFRQQNQFVSDASHELRTPISVIKGYANLMDRWGKREPAVLQESIDSIKAETEHMSMLVKRLLFMAKTDQGKIQIQRQPLSLTQVAEDVIREMSVLGAHQTIDLQTSGDDFIQGDYDLIKQMFWIFLENAVKYSKTPEDRIQIILSEESGKRCVRIRDEGVGIDQEHLPYIFERFYRADKSRSNEVPGTGLGLSIAAWILKQHEAAVDVVSEPDRGTEIMIWFPGF